MQVCHDFLVQIRNDAPRNTLGTIVLWDNVLCRIIWCVVQKEHIVEIYFVIYLVFSTSKDFLVCNLYTIRAFKHFIVHSTN